MMRRTELSRREFLRQAGTVGAASAFTIAGGGALLAACAESEGTATTATTLAGATTTSAQVTTTGASAPSLLDQLREQGYVRAAFNNEPPSNFINEDGELVGEAVEIARAVLAELGIPEMDGVLTEFSGIIPSLQAERVAMSGLAFFILPERCEQVWFTDPIRCLNEAFVVESGNPHNISRYEDFLEDATLRLGIVEGGASLAIAEDLGIPAEQIVILGDVQSVPDGLLAGRFEASPATSSTVQALADQNPSALQATEPFVPVVDGEERLGCSGFAFKDKELRDAFNEKLRELMDDGTIDEIQASYEILSADIEEGRHRTAEELCDGLSPA